MAKTLLIVDDDPTQRRQLEALITRDGHRCLLAEDGQQALDIMAGRQGDAVALMLLDITMPVMNGLDALTQIRPLRPSIPAIMLTANGSVSTVVKAMKAGAADFIVKPASPARLRVSIENALRMGKLTQEVARLGRKSDNRMNFSDLIAEAPPMRQSIHLARRAAKSGIPVLIEGESGVGKEVMARAIQGASDRAGKPFIAVNCGAIPENLVESILFGHEKGAFTGATERRIGTFEKAHRGTLFLDEIGELPLDAQVKLLRALQEGEIEPVGAKRPVKVDIRLISATNRKLLSRVETGDFREDLYYRIAVFPLTLPPLRERAEDIPALISHFIQVFAAQEGRRIGDIDPETGHWLTLYPWPGNIRQLENAIYRAVVLAEHDTLGVQDFPQILASHEISPPESCAGVRTDSAGGQALRDTQGHVRTLASVEAEMIAFAMEKYHGRMSEIARRLGIGRSTLYRKVAELGLGEHARQTA